jgi:hypothetical protein
MDAFVSDAMRAVNTGSSLPSSDNVEPFYPLRHFIDGSEQNDLSSERFGRHIVLHLLRSVVGTLLSSPNPCETGLVRKPTC